MIKMIMMLIVLLLASLLSANAKFSFMKQQKPVSPLPSSLTSSSSSVPSSGIIDYIGSTNPSNGETTRWSTPLPSFEEFTRKQLRKTQFNLWKQPLWKKIKGKVILRAKIGGSIGLEQEQKGSPFSFGSAPDFLTIDNLEAINNLFQYGAHDPRIKAIFIEIEGLNCGYAKLQEIRRVMHYFKQSGKKIYAYCSAGAEKELFLSLECDEFYIPPDGGLDLRGFSGAATFLRGVFDKIGIEPQVQRIGKYKSFGDTFNRTSISEAQREVISSLLMESSDFWIDSVSNSLNKSREDTLKLWDEQGIKTPYDYRDLGFCDGVKYLDQVEAMVKDKYREEYYPSFIARFFTGIQDLFKRAPNSTIQEFANLVNNRDTSEFQDYDLSNEFIKNPRRQIPELIENIDEEKKKEDEKLLKEKQKKEMFVKAVKARKTPNYYPAGMYLKKMRAGSGILDGLKIKQVLGGSGRIAIINAVGGISSGKSGNSGLQGKSLGSDTLIEMIRMAKADSGIKGVVLRVDSPGGSALASDLMWREIRALCKEKPVVASMVDVAASGGYYISMACDKILAEEFTITGSIGVVTSKFNLEKLNEKLGYNTEVISRGRYAEILASNRGFTDEEAAYFEEGAQKAYKSFTSKAAASRNMTIDDMLNVAQGRVWTGRQALNRNLVDKVGGLWEAVSLVYNMTDLRNQKATNQSIRIQYMREPKSGFKLPFGIGSNIESSSVIAKDPFLYLCDSSVSATNLVSSELLGVGPYLKGLNVDPLLAYSISQMLGPMTPLIGSTSSNPMITLLSTLANKLVE